MKRLILMAASVILALSLAAPVAFAQAEQGSKAPKTAGDLAAAWWQWALSEPEATNPLIGSYTQDVPPGDIQCDGEPVTATQADTWFLAGSTGTAPEVRTCSVPAGSQLFFPIVTTSWTFTDPETDTDKLARESVQSFMSSLLSDPEFSMVVTVDGKEVHGIVRGKSDFFDVQLQEGNLLGAPAGTYRALADGFWVTLPPLSEGEHTIHVVMTSSGFSQDITYHLTVE
jgi:hypothetical protein